MSLKSFLRYFLVPSFNTSSHRVRQRYRQKLCTYMWDGEMFVDGQHAHIHARQPVKQRHDGIATAIGAVLRHLDRADLSEYGCKYEVPIDTLQERLPKR